MNRSMPPPASLPPAVRTDDFFDNFFNLDKDPSGDTTFIQDHQPTALEDRLEADAANRRAASTFEHH